MKDMSNLDLATRMLEAVEVGFRNAHGPGLQRLTALKGEFCAEKLLYVRLHLLQVTCVIVLVLCQDYLSFQMVPGMEYSKMARGGQIPAPL